METSQDKYALQKVMIRRTVPLEEAEKHYKSITKRKPRKERATEDWWHFRYLPPTKFVPRSFRTKVVNEDIHLIFGKLKDDHARLEGRGLFDYFKKGYDYVKNKAVDAFDYIKNAVSVTDYSATTKPLLDRYGMLPIVAITIRREPLNIALELALQGVSEGKWLELKKKYGFDTFFHLSMVVTVAGAVERVMKSGRKVNTPKKLAIEKLAVVSINEDTDIKPTMETLDVKVTHKFTIKEMFDKAREKYGDTRFFSYSALGNNNCQNFIQMLLTVEGLYTEEVKQFVFQDISALVKELPESTQLFSQGVTQLGALANKYLGVGGRKKKGDVVIPKKEFVKEHRHLVKLLSKSEDPALQKEAKDQAEELKMKGGACWKGYEMIGMKMKKGKKVPNCVKKGGSSRTHSQAFGDDDGDEKDEDDEDEDDFDDREEMLYEQEQEEMRRMVFNDAVEGYREEIEQSQLPFQEFAQIAETGYLTALQVDPDLTDQEIEDVVEDVFNQFMAHHIQRRNRTPAIGGAGSDEEVVKQIKSVVKRHVPKFREIVDQTIERLYKNPQSDRKIKRELKQPILNFGMAVMGDPELNYSGLTDDQKEMVSKVLENAQNLVYQKEEQKRLQTEHLPRPENPVARELEKEEDEKVGQGKRVTMEDLRPKGGSSFIRAMMKRMTKK